MNIINRNEASKLGLRKYFTGNPCKHNHICERYVNTGCCEVCERIKNQKFRKNNPNYGHNHYIENIETYTKQIKQHRMDNPEYYRERNKSHYENNKIHCNELVRLWKTNNRGKVLAACATRRSLQLQRTVKWANLECIKEIYTECSLISVTTGILHHVDHIVPLRGKLVCGLHVEHNLRIVTKWVNLSKGNKLIDITD